MTSSAKTQAALAFAELGCRVVPAAGKNPGELLGAGWHQRASRDPEVFKRWWDMWPTANVAIIPDRALLPVDVDNPSSWELFLREHGPVPDTPEYLSGGDGGRCRLLFQFPGDEALAHGRRDLARGVQLRHSNDTNLICVVPPGINPDTGQELEWLTDLSAPLAEFPSAWLELLTDNNSGPKRGRDEWGELMGETVTHVDGRHPRLMEIGAYLMAKLDSAAQTHALLLAWNEKCCEPPKPENEVTSIVLWLADREAKNRGR
jgi:Bifunctional DNA primase/polymerase, N-terminal